MKQYNKETIREYIQWLNYTTLKVPSATSEILMSAFFQRLQEGIFFWSLAKKPLTNYDDLLGKVKKCINVDEAQKGKEDWFWLDRTWD